MAMQTRDAAAAERLLIHAVAFANAHALVWCPREKVALVAIPRKRILYCTVAVIRRRQGEEMGKVPRRASKGQQRCISSSRAPQSNSSQARHPTAPPSPSPSPSQRAGSEAATMRKEQGGMEPR